MITREEALRYRAAIVKAAKSLSDEEALAAPLLYNKWTPDIDVEQGDRLNVYQMDRSGRRCLKKNKHN